MSEQCPRCGGRPGYCACPYHDADRWPERREGILRKYDKRPVAGAMRPFSRPGKGGGKHG